MNTSSELLAIAGALVFVLVALVFYVATLARAAFRLRAELQDDMPRGLKTIIEEVEALLRVHRLDLEADLHRGRTELDDEVRVRSEQLYAEIRTRLAALEERTQVTVTRVS